METADATSEIYMYNNVLQQDMRLLDLELRKIGNSMGFVIPADIIEKDKLKLGKVYSVHVIEDRMAGVRAGFGSLKKVIDTDEAMKEVSDGGRD